MIRTSLLTFALSLSLLAGCGSAPRPVSLLDQADASAKVAILETVDRFFEAMSRRDAATCATLMLEDGLATVMANAQDGWRFSRRSQKTLIEGISGGRGVPEETYWDPIVLVRGPIAVVWAPYRFVLDGVESHRGIDVFDMVLRDGRWLIASSMWTHEKGEDLRPTSPSAVRPASLRE